VALFHLLLQLVVAVAVLYLILLDYGLAETEAQAEEVALQLTEMALLPLEDLLHQVKVTLVVQVLINQATG
jgi:hypothetical protein